jgi:hypothetical protein
MNAAPTRSYAAPVTVIREHLSKRELYRLDGSVPLSRDSLVELPDGKLARVVAVRLMLDEPTADHAQLIVEVSTR